MTTTAPHYDGVARQATPVRVQSIDIFRGLTIAVMIFVNDLSGVHGLPWWTYHMPANIDAMTYVDMVFPCFLFIVGLSIPLAVKRRLKLNSSRLSLWFHIVIRAVALITLGLILANAEKVDAPRMSLSANGWALLALLGAMLLWGGYGDAHRHKKVFLGLRILGLVVMTAMLVSFRRTTHDGHIAWIDASYPEILGLIGLTYIAVCLLYIPTRRWLWAPLTWFLALVVFNVLCSARWIVFTEYVPLYIWPFSNGAMACITMAGVVTSSIFLGDHRWQQPRQKMLLAFVFAVMALVTGRLLTPLGISKIRATPTWSLYSAGAAVLIFTALYWICDVRKQTSWAGFVRPAGSNPLLTYLLPDVYSYLVAMLGVSYLFDHWNLGLPGVLRSVVFTILMLALSALLTKLKISMHL